MKVIGKSQDANQSWIRVTWNACRETRHLHSVRWSRHKTARSSQYYCRKSTNCSAGNLCDDFFASAQRLKRRKNEWEPVKVLKLRTFFLYIGQKFEIGRDFFENKCSKIFVSVTIFKKCSAQNALWRVIWALGRFPTVLGMSIFAFIVAIFTGISSVFTLINTLRRLVPTGRYRAARKEYYEVRKSWVEFDKEDSKLSPTRRKQYIAILHR